MNSKALLCLTLFTIEIAASEILVQLPNGIIRGKQSVTHTNTSFYSFLKVPYASPPIGDLRFKPPVSPQNWTGILNTTVNDAICYQVPFNFSIETEDCLYLNIYTPRLPNDGETLSYPVIYYIHGGGFILGTCQDFICGADFLIEYDVVVVTVNYRLGPFGFLSTGDSVIPGNNGLKDQLLGIKWVHENIHLFGGDPRRVTIVGQSAGAASVAYQCLNKKSEGLFWGAVCQSGSFLSPWSFQRSPREIAFKTAAFLNDTFKISNNSQELLEFLQSVSADELDAASYQLSQTETPENRQMSQGMFYAPVIEPEHEDAFITSKMYGDLKSGNFIKIPLLIGITSEESLEDGSNLQEFRRTMESYDANPEWLVPKVLNIQNNEKKRRAGQLIRRFYTKTNLSDNLGAGIRYFSDNSFTRSVIKHALLQSEFTDVYFYQFSYDGLIGNVSSNISGTEKVAHIEDTKYLWHTVFQGYDNTYIELFPKNDILTHQRMLTLWTNFAKTLNPTPTKSELLENVIWPTVSSGRPKHFWYLDIDTNLTIKNYPKIVTYLEWNFIYLFAEAEFDTY